MRLTEIFCGGETRSEEDLSPGHALMSGAGSATRTTGMGAERRRLIEAD